MPCFLWRAWHFPLTKLFINKQLWGIPDIMEKIVKLKDIDVRELVLESIRRLIIESQGINDELEEKASTMAAYIRNNILASPVEYDKRRKQNYHLLSYSHDFEGKKFSWTIIGYIYPDDSAFENDINVRFSEGMSSSDGRDIFFGWITFPMTEKGWFSYGEVADSIYHEMLHLLKAKKIGKESGNKEFIAITNNQYNAATGLGKDIALICYMSREDEQDAFINGLYGKLKEEFLQKRNMNVGEIFYDSELCRKIADVKCAIENLRQASMEEVNGCLKIYNTKATRLTYKKLMNLGKNALIRLKQKTARMLNHYNNYLYKKGFRPNPPKNILDY